jgi:hypothetical protein
MPADHLLLQEVDPKGPVYPSDLEDDPVPEGDRFEWPERPFDQDPGFLLVTYGDLPQSLLGGEFYREDPLASASATSNHGPASSVLS